MNRNGKRMKLEATRLTKAQRCEIITNLSKPNTTSKHALGREYEVSEGVIGKVWDNRENILQRIRWTRSNLLRHLLNLKVLPTSKDLKLYTTLSFTLTINCFAPMFKRKLNKCMMSCDDRLRHSSETLTNWHLISSMKNSCIRDKWLCMTCSNNNLWTPILVKKNSTLDRDAYLNGCILKWEIIVMWTTLYTRKPWHWVLCCGCKLYSNPQLITLEAYVVGHSISIGCACERLLTKIDSFHNHPSYSVLNLQLEHSS